jgi:hypothetical protein
MQQAYVELRKLQERDRAIIEAMLASASSEHRRQLHEEHLALEPLVDQAHKRLERLNGELRRELDAELTVQEQKQPGEPDDRDGEGDGPRGRDRSS